jgi:phosphatidylserine/phosphatidylglycerophosphate/cardiolipin synthase-like enzyme
MERIEIVSSLDSPFVIPETYSRGMKCAQSVRVCSPWVEKPFVHLMKRAIQKGASVDFLIKRPDSVDATFRAMEALEADGKESQWNIDVICVPYLHAKFAIVDEKNIFFGSANATNGGLYNNVEILTAFYDMPSVANRFVQIFESMKKQNRNLPWEIVRDFHGSSVNRTLVESAIKYLKEMPDKDSHVAILNLHLRKHGFDFNSAKEGIEQMLRYGYLYSPREDYVRLVPKYE